MKIINEQAYLKRAKRNRQIDEARHEKTRQRQFELGFLSLQELNELYTDKNAHTSATNDNLLAIGRRDFSLHSPSEITSFNLDFEYYENLLSKTDISLLTVFRAIFSGLSWQDLGMPKRTFNWQLKKLENFLAHFG